MRKLYPGIFLSFLIIVVPASFQKSFNSPVKGSVSPSDGALRAWVISSTDTIGAPVNRGYFTIEAVKPGNYMLMLEGKPPYRNTVKEGIRVVNGEPTDVGVIEMGK